MAQAYAKHHDYHLVDPSPWPIVGSISALLMAVGGITWMHHMFAAAPLVFGLGVVGILYTFIGWWRDVIREAQYDGFHTRVVQRIGERQQVDIQRAGLLGRHQCNSPQFCDVRHTRELLLHRITCHPRSSSRR